MSEVLAALFQVVSKGSIKFKLDLYKLQWTLIKNGKIKMTDLAVEFQKNICKNNGLIGYKALEINCSKERFCNAALKEPYIVK